MGLLLAPAEAFGLWPRLFLPCGQKKAYYAVLAQFRPSLVFISNIIVTLKRIQKKSPKKFKKSYKTQKIQKFSKNLKDPKKSKNPTEIKKNKKKSMLNPKNQKI